MSNDKMREALEFYANPTHWSSGDVPGHVYAYEDAGAFAREALTQQPESEPAEKASAEVAYFFEVLTSDKSGLTHLVALPEEIPVSDGIYHVHIHGSPQPTPQVPEPSREVFEEELRGWLGGDAEYKDRRLERRGGNYKDDAVEMSWFVYRKTNRIGPFAPSIAEKREWISCEERLPTEEDADFNGDVIWWAPILNAPVVRAWCDSTYKDFSPFWMPTGLQRPEPPINGGE